MKALSPLFLSKLDSVITSNLANEEFSINALCRELTISYTHIYRKIRKETGLSPSIYIRIKRLEQASLLIKRTNLNISDIAYQTGFNTPAYFSTCFSKHYGCPPSQYRIMEGKGFEGFS